MALQTVVSKDLRQITLRPYLFAFIKAIVETVYREWGDLDRLLVRFRTSCLVRPKVAYEMCWSKGNVSGDVGEEDVGDYASRLLPELTRRGLVRVAKYDW